MTENEEESLDWVYCTQHLAPHSPGWCTVPVEMKIPLEGKSFKDCAAECRKKGFKLFQDSER